MHPADKVAAAIDDHPIRKVAHPWWDIDAEGRPLVRCPLRVAVDHYRPVIEAEHSIRKFGLAKSGPCFNGVDGFAVDFQCRVDVVEIAVTPAPEIEASDLLRCSDDLGFIWRESVSSTAE